ncbi:MAG: DUF4136 domain-containing protein [Gemmatimonadetes bacterium]|nr:MAG: DUF4136 domain-containing protein [Gemmatimonadota bacterium]
MTTRVFLDWVPRRPGLGLLLIAGVVTAGGCGGVRTNVRFDAVAPFEEYESFEWLPAVGPDSAVALDRALHDAVAPLLIARGYEEVEANADFWVYAHAGPRGFDFGRVYRRYRIRPSPGLGADPDPDELGREVLVLDVIDRRRREVVWRGIATRVFAASDGRILRLADAVPALLEPFPPKP